MIISVLVCTPEGEQTIEEKEVPDTWFPSETADKDSGTIPEG